MQTPNHITGFKVIEYGYFPEPILPKGYVPPPDGRPPLKPIQNVAVGVAEGVDGYYLLFCTADWEYVTYCFSEHIDDVKRQVLVEFGQDITRWYDCEVHGAAVPRPLSPGEQYGGRELLDDVDTEAG